MENYQGMDGDIVSVTALGKAAVPAKSELAENLLAGLQHVLTMCPGAPVRHFLISTCPFILECRSFAWMPSSS